MNASELTAVSKHVSNALVTDSGYSGLTVEQINSIVSKSRPAPIRKTTFPERTNKQTNKNISPMLRGSWQNISDLTNQEILIFHKQNDSDHLQKCTLSPFVLSQII
jgi:hypothetical protein